MYMCVCCLCDADDDDFDSINIMSKSINKRWEREIPPWPSLFTLIYIVKYAYTHIYLCMSLYNICVYVYRVWMCIYIQAQHHHHRICIYREKRSYNVILYDEWWWLLCFLLSSFLCVCLYCIICVFDGLEFARSRFICEFLWWCCCCYFSAAACFN